MMMFIFMYCTLYIFCNNFTRLFRKGHTQKCCSPILYLAERISRNWGDRFSSVPFLGRGGGAIRQARSFVSNNLGDNLHPGTQAAQKTPLLLKAFHNFSILFKIFQNIQIFKRLLRRIRIAYGLRNRNGHLYKIDVSSCCCFYVVHLRRRSHDKHICIHLYWSIQF